MAAPGRGPPRRVPRWQRGLAAGRASASAGGTTGEHHRRVAGPAAAVTPRPPPPVAAAGAGDGARERYLAAIKSGKPFFFNAVVAQAYRIEVTPERRSPSRSCPTRRCRGRSARRTASGSRRWRRRRSGTTCRCRSPRPIRPRNPRPAPPAPTPAPVGARPPRPPVPPSPASDDELRQEALSRIPRRAVPCSRSSRWRRTKIEEL